VEWLALRAIAPHRAARGHGPKKGFSTTRVARWSRRAFLQFQFPAIAATPVLLVLVRLPLRHRVRKSGFGEFRLDADWSRCIYSHRYTLMVGLKWNEQVRNWSNE